MTSHIDSKTAIQQMRAVVISTPGQAGLLSGLVALLDNAPDSALIIEGLKDVNPKDYSDTRLRERISELLKEAGDNDMAALWENTSNDDLPSNVISLASASNDISAPKLENTRPGQNSLCFDDIGGLEKVKQQMRRRIINPFLKKELFAKFKKRSGGGVLMYGPPGCGKTMLAKALAHECNANFMNIKAADILDRWIGSSEKNIVEMFARARNNKPVVIFFDEVEALAQKREFGDSHHVNTTVSALLTEMDGFESDNEGVLMLGATNVPWSLDTAFRRPGRFDRTIFVPPPDKLARRFILQNQLEDRPVEENLDLSFVIAKSSGFSGADLIGLVDTALDYAIEESDETGSIAPLSATHFKEALQEVRPSTGEWLSQASAYAQHANKDGLYDDLSDFLKKYGR
ncbi:ATPase family protein associated with various cellular activities (AAA) [Litorimonas taeanensis]|uniref:ATPase family protein associated with various cellular activities (AAA) n=1 Tax=Litorimonas taeanensis TaxID=568099 RepID=A0A420WKW2_9PROT|nr:ATP-binding protein [Litorimonas taeanensis]RKQ71663.1 ATPase family protein associated with various cellular activities (AAA) [Litorimonas taeanensis]